MRFSGRLFVFTLALLGSPYALAETTIGWQFGAAHNQSIESNHPAGSSLDTPVGPQVDRWDAYVGVQLYYHVNDRFALGAGTRLVFNRWPMDRSNAFWELDALALEYRMFGNIRLRASGGLGKAYENQAAYGRAYSLAVVGPLTHTLDWGVGYMRANVNQETGYVPSLEGGSARAWTLFLEYPVGR